MLGTLTRLGVASVVFLVVAAGLASSVNAVDILQPGCQAGASTKFCQDVNAGKNTDRILGPTGIVTKITQTITYIAGAIAVVMVILGGLQYALSGGSPGKDGSGGVAGAKKTILYALVGLVVTIFSQLIVSFVLSKF